MKTENWYLCSLQKQTLKSRLTRLQKQKQHCITCITRKIQINTFITITHLKPHTPISLNYPLTSWTIYFTVHPQTLHTIFNEMSTNLIVLNLTCKLNWHIRENGTSTIKHIHFTDTLTYVGTPTNWHTHKLAHIQMTSPQINTSTNWHAHKSATHHYKNS